MGFTQSTIDRLTKPRYTLFFRTLRIQHKNKVWYINLVYCGIPYLWHFHLLKIYPVNMQYSTPLYDLLSVDEITAIKANTNVRNCKTDQLTVEELTDILPCLCLTGIEKQMYDSDPPVKTLWVLMKRYLIHHA